MLAALILVAAVANLNLAVANVALPDIGKAFGAWQTELDLVAVGYSLGLAASVLYLGALGDRYGRKLMLLLGMGLSIPASLLAALAPSIGVLFAARLLGGLAAGMAYPTTLALITALWSGPARTRSIALWSGIGGAISALGPLLSGALLAHFDWGSVFFVTLPLALLALVMAWLLVPAHVNEATEPVDNLGGILSVRAGRRAGARRSTSRPSPARARWRSCSARSRSPRRWCSRAPAPRAETRCTTWRSPAPGLLGGRVRGDHRLRHADGRDVHRPAVPAERARLLDAQAGLAILPARRLHGADRAPLREARGARGARVTLLVGYVFCLLGFVDDAASLWEDDIAYWQVGLAYAFIGVGVGFAGTPASRSLTGSVPVRRAGMASGTADLQRDLGGAIMQSILGALLTAGYAAAVASAIAASPNKALLTNSVQTELTKSFASAADAAQQYPQYATQIIAGAKESFLQGADWAYAAGIIAIVLGATLVFFMFPKHRREVELMEEYHAEDTHQG